MKYSPKSNPETNVTRRVARNYNMALATMIRMGDMDVELVYELNPSGGNQVLGEGKTHCLRVQKTQQ